MVSWLIPAFSLGEASLPEDFKILVNVIAKVEVRTAVYGSLDSEALLSLSCEREYEGVLAAPPHGEACD